MSLGIYGDMPAARDAITRGDSGTAARFFYCAKASKEDRNFGLENFPPERVNDGRSAIADNAYELEPVLIYADPPYYVGHGGGQWQRISYAPRNACLLPRPDSPQEASDA